MTEPLSLPVRRIAHLDMDAFYASVELLRYPQLRGLPVVIGGARRPADAVLLQQYGQQTLADIPPEAFPRLNDYVGRGVITTATYAARAFGIGSAMGLMKAAKQCPQAILLPVDFDQYRHYSRLFKAEILKIAPVIEDRGIDEVYIDLTEVHGSQEVGGRVLGERIQAAIYDATGLTCSIGIAPNKLLAKMASEFNKPNGISVLYTSDLAARIWPLPCRKINGIGPKTEAKLQANSIYTIGDLAACCPEWLQQHFGSVYGSWLYRAALGEDERTLQTHTEPVSLSRETTFDRDLHAVNDKAELSAIFTRLCERLADDLKRKGYVARTVGVKIRYDNFKSLTRELTAYVCTAEAETLRALAGQCLKRAPLDRRLRLLGVRVGALVKVGEIADLPPPLAVCEPGLPAQLSLRLS